MTTVIDGVDEASRYTFSNADAQGPHQLRLLSDILDEHSTYVLADTGIRAGWQCLDVGPGAGSITDWLAERVRPSGTVTALDLDPRHLQSGENITVRQGDVRTVDLPEAYYDLIHTRLLLLHLAEREMVLDRLVAALKPGGVLVVSDWDGERRDWLLHAPSQAAGEAFEAFQTGLLAELQTHGADLGWARRAPLAMRVAGLVDIRTTVHNQAVVRRRTRLPAARVQRPPAARRAAGPRRHRRAAAAAVRGHARPRHAGLLLPDVHHRRLPPRHLSSTTTRSHREGIAIMTHRTPSDGCAAERPDRLGRLLREFLTLLLDVDIDTLDGAEVPRTAHASAAGVHTRVRLGRAASPAWARWCTVGRGGR